MRCSAMSAPIATAGQGLIPATKADRWGLGSASGRVGLFGATARAPDHTNIAYTPHGDFPVPLVAAKMARFLDLELAEEHRDANE